jgi:uncharacterized protein (DUF2461 family)
MAETAFFSPDVFIFLRQLKRKTTASGSRRTRRDTKRILSNRHCRSLAVLRLSWRRSVLSLWPMRGPPVALCFAFIAIFAFPRTSVPSRRTLAFHFSHAGGKGAHAPVFYLHLEPDNCFVAAGIWHPDNRALTRVRTAIARDTEQWAKVRKKLSLEGDRLSRPPRGFDGNHPFIDDLKMKDFVASVALSEDQICSDKLMRDFVSACRTMSPLVEFTTKALGLKY